MKRILLLLTVFCIFTISQAQIINEDLRGGVLPTGWTQSNVTFTTSALGYANLSGSNGVLTTSSFNASAFASIDVSFDVAKFGSGTNGPVTIEYSINGGTSWVSAGNSSTPTSSSYLSNTINISSLSATMLVRIVTTSSPSNKRLRDFVITGVGTGGGCSITSSGLSNIQCNDNSTTGVTTDDFLSFDLNVTAGTGTAATYTVSVSGGGASTISPTSGTYGTLTPFTLNNGSANGTNVTLTITDATTGTCTLVETVTDPGACSAPPVPIITTSVSSLPTFTYAEGNGPSAESSFTVEGINLTANIDVVPPSNWGISLVSGGPYQSTTITLTQSAGTVAATTIYTRMIAGLLNVNSPFSGGSISSSSTLATTQNVAVDGIVTPQPPSNDECIGATPLTVGTSCSFITSTNVNGTNSGAPAPGCGNYADADVWFSMTVPPSGELRIETASGGITDGAMALYSGTCGSLTLIECDDDDGPGSMPEIIRTGLTTGSTVYLTFWDFNGGTEGTFDICAWTPAACVAPVNQATALTTGNITGTSIDVDFTLASPAADNYIIVRHTSPTLGASPVDGTSYAVSASLGSGTVIYNGDGTSLPFTDSGLSSLTTYYYFVFAYNDIACAGGPAYNITALTGNATTLFAPTLCADVDFTGAGNSGSYSTITWTDAGIPWEGTDARGDEDLNGAEAITLRNGSLTNTSSVTGGIGTLSFDYARVFSGNSTLQVFVNGTQFGSNISVTNTTSTNFSIAVNISGPIDIELINSGNRTVINNLQWTCAVAAPEIEIQGGGFEIVDGDITPSLTDDTDFGTTAVAGGTVVRTFTILNIGTADLEVTNVTSSNAVIFAVSGITLPATIVGSSSTTFTVTFDPSVLGTASATITVANDDPDEDPYTFNIEGEGTNSNSSDIIESPGFTYTSNIDYTVFQAAGPLTNATGNVGVFRFEVRDGGGVADADALGTELTDITFDLGSTHAAYIRSAALFDGLSMRDNSPSINVGAGTITFSGLSGVNFTAADGGSLTLTLRVSFLTNVVDNEQLQFTISDAVAGASSSVFAAANAGGATSSIVGDRNRLEVTASSLNFTTQPSDALVNITMAAVEVEGIDVNGNRDLDWIDNVSITSTGTMTGSPITVAAVSGVATFSGIVHTVGGTGFTLDAAHSSFTTVTSTMFDITDLPLANGDYRTTGSGDWNSNSASPAIWERYNGTSWASSNSPSYNTTNRIFIRNGHTITTNGSWGSGARLYIIDGGTFINEHSGTADEVFIYENGILDIREYFRVGTGTGTLEVFDGGIIYFDDEGNANLTTSIWNGTETFHPLSEFHVNDIDALEYLYDGDITTNTYNGYTAALGIVYIDFAVSLTGATPASEWESVVGPGADGNNLCHGNLEFVSTRGNTRFRFARSVDVSTGIGGDLIIQSGIGSSRRVELATGTSDLVLTIEGNLEMDCAGDLAIRGGNSPAGSSIINIKGDLLINGSNVASSTEFRMNTTSYGTANGGMHIINLEGDLLVSDGFLDNVAARDDVEFNFVGNTLQTLNVASVVSNGVSNRGIPMYVRNDASVILEENNLQLNNASLLNVQDGGTFNFGFDTDNITALIVTQPVSSGGVNEFDLDQGGRLFITSPSGITTTTSLGNVQVSPSNRTYNQTAFFHYIGREDQVTGNALLSSSSAKHVFVQLIDDNTTLTPSNDIGISNGTTLGTEGRLHIDSGRVLGSGAADFEGSGFLVMTGGWYQEDVLTSHSITPQLSGAYTLTGGTIELSSAGDQTLRGSRDYNNLMISGSNVLGSDDKTPTSAFTVDSLLTITETPIFDISNLGMTGDAGIEMDGGLLRISKLNDATPELTGVNTPYLITDGTIEWYGSSSSQNQLVRGVYGSSSTTVSYHNMEVNSAAANTDDFNVGLQAGIELTGVANINSPAVFQMDPSDHIDGTGTFNVLAGSTYKYGDEFGITLGASTALSAGALRMSTPRIGSSFSRDASYGFVGSGDMVTGNALPGEMVNMYLDKTNAGDKVSLTNDAEITNTLNFLTQGILKTDANLLFVSNNDPLAIINANTSGTDRYVEGRLQWTTDGSSSYTFPIGHVDEDAQGFTIDVTGTSGSEILGFLETNSSAPILSYAYCDLETPNGGTGQIGSGIGTPDGVLDQIEFNIESPLQWDVTNPGGGISTYDITVLANGSQDISPVVSSNAATAIRFLMKNGEPGNTGVATTNGAPAFNANGFAACPNQYTLSGMTSFSDFTLNGANGLNTTLPVELIFFDVRGMGDSKVLCSWATATEINNDFYTIERSEDGENFEEVGELNGAGNSSIYADYEFIDNEAYQGISYYRLKQTDFDGTYTYSNVAAVNLGSFNSNQVEVYPIPFEDNLTVVTNSQEVVKLRLYDLSGKLVLNETINFTIDLNLTYLDAGTYFLQLTSESIHSYQKIVKK